jgi:hypothetical protein
MRPTWCDAWGDPISSVKPDDTLRIGVLNLNGWPKDATDPKNQHFQNLVNNYDFDVMASSETNRYWPQVPIQDRLYERTFKWWQNLHISLEKYTSLYSQFLQEHNLVERAFSLQTVMTYPANSAMTDERESIDALRVKGMQEAERKCRKFRTGEVPWSPSLQEIMDRIAAWKLMRRKREGKRVSSQLLRRKLKSASLESRSSASLTESIEALNDAYTELKIFKKQAQLKRTSWLEELASARAIDGIRKVATEVRQLEQREKQRRNARLIRRANGRLRSGGISSVIAPVGENYDWVEVTDKKRIEQALLDENQRRFNQACDTPFMTHPLYNAVGPLGIGKGAQDILNGTFVFPAGTDPYAAKLIKQLQAPDCISSSEPLSVAITTEDHSSGWKRAKERTSSGPSGLHFGHFIAGTRHSWIL